MFSLPCSILCYIGVAIFSPLLAVAQLLGSLLACFAALGVRSCLWEKTKFSPRSGLPPSLKCTLVFGLTHLCSLPEQLSSSHNLPSGFLRYFKVIDHLPPRSLPLHLFAVLFTVVLHSSLSPILLTFHLPVFTLPFVITSWFFLLFSTGNDAVIRSLQPFTPEQRIMRARKSSEAIMKLASEATNIKENQPGVAEQGEA